MFKSPWLDPPVDDNRLLKFRRRHIADGGPQPPVIEPIDLFERFAYSTASRLRQGS